ncbi:YaiI/YqxD family protein [Candidatus Enterovibrio escicola]|uniref:UPF0178 protein BTN49_2930 n=1 Tax=Candidatus Enterovibrio escicola TaxID=1927127 RepID=A0A2A5SZR4_9GAMM|nr:YaiI/YqxD family protein [Candidatus Enterovibrio escacola]PCS21391.1 hypothetical protein BTN49_2930 [Candidatus Enterovibrio escacola]
MSTIWVDADACPVVIKEILYRAADRTKTQVIFVANQSLKIPISRYITYIQVPKGFDVADDEIIFRMKKGDLVITADIALAAEIIEIDKESLVLNPCGKLYTHENIRQRLNIRDFMDTMRSSGIHTIGPASLTQQDRQNFGNELDMYLQRPKLK